ncbi:hypothetical protein CAPTEDRAFT_193018 [Capitella teleta]|uniref:Uncharacterized protein n=1 Tax=Capitella teleta TaxID=283909 RepID=R7TMG1_CAPTE|nr:hypothetical protein CAPTEDRAFT_197072 [Capitella teleta]ELU16025.1 hypothetical protein CAPTEDRAFT_193018 [Capitella teleta]|eukprot:ELT92275.1 hypothetical protein CAPTEDRAFT_197072 [Capitella teleta]
MDVYSCILYPKGVILCHSLYRVILDLNIIQNRCDETLSMGSGKKKEKERKKKGKRKEKERKKKGKRKEKKKGKRKEKERKKKGNVKTTTKDFVVCRDLEQEEEEEKEEKP